MSGLAALVRWDGPEPEARELRRMVTVVGHRGPDGLAWEVAGAAGLGSALLAQRRGGGAAQPCWLPDRSAAAVADARIDNRAELWTELGGVARPGAPPSDPELILAAYRRWGDAFAERLVGDFAIVIWDAARRRVLAARDPFGARPLFYHWRPGLLLAGSEPKQLLVMPDVPVEPDRETVAGYLLHGVRDVERTFFQTVRRLPPGCRLAVTADRLSLESSWHPACDPPAGGDRGRILAELRSRLEASVRCRLDTDFPVAVHLSGGLDSSSVVVTLASFGGGPPATAVSALYPGLACDEQELIEITATQTGLPSRRYRPGDSSPLEGLADELWQLDSPYADLLRSWWLEERKVLAELGARTLLTGFGGDELMDDSAVVRDYARQGRWLAVLAEVATAGAVSWRSGRSVLRRAAAEVLSERQKLLARRWLRQAREPVPDWIDPAVTAQRPEPSGRVEGAAEPWPSATQRWTWSGLRSPLLLWGNEALEVLASRIGVTPAHPYLDRRLAEYVLGLPSQLRAPRGRPKRLLRDALADRLPPPVRDRRTTTDFASHVSETVRRWGRDLTSELAAGSAWHSEGLTRRNALVRAAARLSRSAPADVHEVFGVWRAVTVELWLRGLGRYQFPG